VSKSQKSVLSRIAKRQAAGDESGFECTRLWKALFSRLSVQIVDLDELRSGITLASVEMSEPACPIPPTLRQERIGMYER
jgi:hypothetical protein